MRNFLLYNLLILFAFFALPLQAKPKAPHEKIKVACVGNSITYGLAIKDRAKDSYPSQLQRMLGPAYEVCNFGKSGATLLRHGHRPYFEQKEFQQAMAFKGDIAIIHLGVNDTDPRDWPNYRDEFVDDYLALIDSLKKANPKVRVLIARLTPIRHDHPRFISGTKLWHDEIQDAIDEIARLANVELIDFHSVMYPHPDYSVEGIHPNPKGARLLAKAVYSGITGDYGGLKLSPLYTDYVVLQRGMPLDLHGTANAGSTVTVTLTGKTSEGSGVNKSATATADNRGNWTAVLPSLNVGTDYTLTVTCKDNNATATNRTNYDLQGDVDYKIISADRSMAMQPYLFETPASETGNVKLKSNKKSTVETKVFHHVAVGEVWLCSGQSNMQFMLYQCDTGKADAAKANDPELRFFDMKWRYTTYDEEWPLAALDSVDRLEYFAPTEWTSCTPNAAAWFSAIGYYFGKTLRDSLKVPVGLINNAVGGATAESWVDRNTLETKFPAILQNFIDNDFIQEWARYRAWDNVGADTTHMRRHPFMPCYLYEAGIMPFAQYPIKGVVWYQGESNAHNFEAHEKIFTLLVQSWRKNWSNSKLPFYFVQLSSLNRPSWTWFRDSQRRLMDSIPYTGMVVTTDVGDSLNVHYPHKKPVGERLAYWALNKDYGHNCVPSGPLFKSVVKDGDALIVSFNYGEGLKTSDGKAVRTFEIAHDDGRFHPATVVIEGDKVRLTSSEVKDPRYVRYGWQPFTRANLVNAAGLPASTFRAEISLHNKL